MQSKHLTRGRVEVELIIKSSQYDSIKLDREKMLWYQKLLASLVRGQSMLTQQTLADLFL